MFWSAKSIASALEAAGFNNYCIDYERGLVVAQFTALVVRETISQTEGRRRKEFYQRWKWTPLGFTLVTDT